jgi:hypothetical protein
MMEKMIISEFKNEFIFWKIIIIHFVDVKTDPKLQYLIGNEVLQNEITGTQTSFSTNVGGKLSFIPSFLLCI